MSISRAHGSQVVPRPAIGPLGMTPNALATALRLTASRVNEIVREKRGITPDTAMRLVRYFGTTPEFWLDMQSTYALRMAAQSEWDTIVKEVQPLTQPG